MRANAATYGAACMEIHGCVNTVTREAACMDAVKLAGACVYAVTIVAECRHVVKPVGACTAICEQEPAYTEICLHEYWRTTHVAATSVEQGMLSLAATATD